jgi:hypothetical protein
LGFCCVGIVTPDIVILYGVIVIPDFSMNTFF